MCVLWCACTFYETYSNRMESRKVLLNFFLGQSQTGQTSNLIMDLGSIIESDLPKKRKSGKAEKRKSELKSLKTNPTQKKKSSSYSVFDAHKMRFSWWFNFFRLPPLCTLIRLSALVSMELLNCSTPIIVKVHSVWSPFALAYSESSLNR